MIIYSHKIVCELKCKCNHLHTRIYISSMISQFYQITRSTIGHQFRFSSDSSTLTKAKLPALYPLVSLCQCQIFSVF